MSENAIQLYDQSDDSSKNENNSKETFKNINDQVAILSDKNEISKIFQNAYRKKLVVKFEENKQLLKFLNNIESKDKQFFEEISKPFNIMNEINTSIEKKKRIDLMRITTILIIRNKFTDNYRVVLDAINNKKKIKDTLKYFKFDDEIEKLKKHRDDSEKILESIGNKLSEPIDENAIQKIKLFRKADGIEDENLKKLKILEDNVKLKHKELEDKEKQNLEKKKNSVIIQSTIDSNRSKINYINEFYHMGEKDIERLNKEIKKIDESIDINNSELNKKKLDEMNSNNSNKKKKDDISLEEKKNELKKFQEKMDKMNAEILNSNLYQSMNEYIFLIDYSGSMSGDPMKEVIKSFENFIKIRKQNNKTSDKVTVIKFNDDAHFEHLGAKISELSTFSNLCEGGTKYIPAIEMVDDYISNLRNNSRIVLFFLTDGKPSDPENLIYEKFRNLKSKLAKKDFFMFIMGVGNDCPKNILLEMCLQINGGRIKTMNTKTFELLHFTKHSNDINEVFQIFETIEREEMNIYQTKKIILKNQEQEIEEKYLKELKNNMSEWEKEEEMREYFYQKFKKIIEDLKITKSEYEKEIEIIKKNNSKMKEDMNEIENKISLLNEENNQEMTHIERNEDFIIKTKKDYENEKEKYFDHKEIVSKEFDNSYIENEDLFIKHIEDLKKMGAENIQESNHKILKSHLQLFDKNIFEFNLYKQNILLNLDDSNRIFEIILSKLDDLNKKINDFYKDFSDENIIKILFDVFLKYHLKEKKYKEFKNINKTDISETYQENINDVLKNILKLKQDEEDAFEYLFSDITPKELMMKLHEGTEVDEYIKERLEEIDKDVTANKDKIKELKELIKTNFENYKENNPEVKINQKDYIKEFSKIEKDEEMACEEMISDLNKQKQFIQKKKGKIKRILQLLNEKKNEALENTFDAKLGENFTNLLYDIDVNYFKFIKNLEMGYDGIKHSI